MPLAKTVELLHSARAAGGGVGAFNVIGLEHAEAIVRAAELEQAPVILQLSENAVAFRRGQIAPIGHACRALAEAAGVPVALHLDHATGRALCERALDLGFGSVMLDASALPFAENVRATAALAAIVRARGAGLEAELGVVGGKGEPAEDAAAQTDPEEARRYVALTGVDALGVAVGTTHRMLAQTARIDLDLIGRLRAAVPVPLVLHGASGVPDDALLAAVRGGIVKVNFATQLNQAFTGAIRAHLAAHPAEVDPRRYLWPAREAVVAVVRGRIALLRPPARGGEG